MKYNTLLKKFNDFFIRTGIREYCSTVCHGKCCTEITCYGHSTKDYTICHKNLACSVFFCNDIAQMISYYDDEKFYKLMSIKQRIYYTLYKYTNQTDADRFNLFFSIYSVLNHNIPNTSFPKFSDDFYKKINRRMKKAIKEKTDIDNLKP